MMEEANLLDKTKSVISDPGKLDLVEIIALKEKKKKKSHISWS